MTRLLLIAQNFSRDFLLKAQPSAILFPLDQVAENFVIDAIAPEEKKSLGMLLKFRMARFVRICHIWQMFRQGMAWKPAEEPVEIHCRGFLAGGIGTLVKSRARVNSKLVFYLDGNEINRHSGATRRSFARLLLRRTDYVIVETTVERKLMAVSLGEPAAQVLTVEELLKGLSPVSCVYMHPERLAILRYCQGKGIDVGCGSSKTHPDAIGVDIVVGGKEGSVGCEEGRVSQADICASGDNLAMFQDNSLDYIVARHNIEHYVDVVKTLREWQRVLRPGGIAALVIPDDESLDTLRLDLSHKHAFTRESFVNLINAIGGFEIQEIDVCIPGWSFKCVLRKGEKP